MDRRKKKERKQQERQEANKDEPNLPPSDAGATSDQVYNPTQRHTDYQHEQYEPGNLSLPPPMEQSEGPRQQRRSVNEQRRLDSLRQETSSTAMSFHQSVIDLHAAEQEQDNLVAPNIGPTSPIVHTAPEDDATQPQVEPIQQLPRTEQEERIHRNIVHNIRQLLLEPAPEGEYTGPTPVTVYVKSTLNPTARPFIPPPQSVPDIGNLITHPTPVQQNNDPPSTTQSESILDGAPQPRRGLINRAANQSTSITIANPSGGDMFITYDRVSQVKVAFINKMLQHDDRFLRALLAATDGATILPNIQDNQNQDMEWKTLVNEDIGYETSDNFTTLVEDLKTILIQLVDSKITDSFTKYDSVTKHSSLSSNRERPKISHYLQQPCFFTDGTQYSRHTLVHKEYTQFLNSCGQEHIVH